MKITFNTKRQYTERGQVINAEVTDGRCWFHDEDRGIAGSFEWNPYARELQELVMHAYDYGNWRNERIPNKGEARRVES